MEIDDAIVTAYQANGAVLVMDLFADWVECLRDGIERNMAEPGEHAAENTVDGEPGRFFDDYCNWRRIPEFRRFVEESDAARHAARIMESPTAQFFHDHVLVKEQATPRETPWHQDLPYYCVDGTQSVSFWLPLDDVDAASTLRLIAGSHRWPKLLRPVRWKAGEDFYADDSTFMDLPDLEVEGHRILAWSMKPGDAIAFDFRAVHGAGGNLGSGRRRAFSHRWLGDDMRYCIRPGRTSPPYPGIGLKTGDRMREDWFPTLWPGTG